jgi:arylformamidase
MSEAVIWGGMTQAELDAAYDNMAAVADSAERLAGWSERSAALRRLKPDECDIPYGPHPRNRVDVFRCGRNRAQILAFIHGGWWQRNSKEVFSCMAEGPMAAGFDVALIGYTLAPEATLSRIVSEVRQALDLLSDRQAASGRNGRCVLSGWSAGGHLAALTLDHPFVAAGLSISGVFDLEPIRHSYINVRLGLDPEEAAALSPALLTAPVKPLAVAYGLDELPELQRQSVDFAARCASAGSPVNLVGLSDRNHFSILEDLAAPDGALVRAFPRQC